MSHLDAAHNLARWLTRDRNDAEEVVQEAYLRAFHHYASFKGGPERAWLLAIVRNCCYDFLRRRGVRNQDCAFNEETHEAISTAADPEANFLKEERSRLLRKALTELPPDYREILILREWEELSYKEIASIVDVPVGTVMSRLSRARSRLHETLTAEASV
jgi:RNA polymerase sigma factor (sigma-70 family)